jgi:hypothetical protein
MRSTTYAPSDTDMCSSIKSLIAATVWISVASSAVAQVDDGQSVRREEIDERELEAEGSPALELRERHDLRHYLEVQAIGREPIGEQRSPWYVTYGVGGGYFHQWGTESGDSTSAVLFDSHLSAGYGVSGNVVLGLAVAAHPALVPISSAAGDSVAFTTMAMIGPMLAILPAERASIVSYELAVGIGFSLGSAGLPAAVGATASNGVLFHLLPLGEATHFTIALRCLLGVWNAGDQGLQAAIGASLEGGASVF